MNVLPGIIFVIFIFVSQSLSALTISVLENTPSSVVYSKILKEVYTRAGIPLEFVPLPTERSLHQSTRSLIDGELVRIHKVGDIYPTLFRVPTPFTFFEARAFSRTQEIKQDIEKNGWNALQNYRVDIVRGMEHAEVDLAEIKSLVDVDRTDQLFKMLERDRIDVLMSTKVSGYFFTKKFGLKSIHLIEPALQRHDLYHYLHEKNKKYIPILDEAVRAIKESGELTELRENLLTKSCNNEILKLKVKL